MTHTSDQPLFPDLERVPYRGPDAREPLAYRWYDADQRTMRYPFDGEEPSLSRDEARALELFARLTPGFALAVSDVAEELHARAYEVRAVLERLQRLKLVQPTVGGLDDETAYTLTSPGRALLRLRQPRPGTA